MRETASIPGSNGGPSRPGPDHPTPPETLGLVPGTEPARRFIAALRSGNADEARRVAVEEAPAYELAHFIIEPLIVRLEALPRRFMAGREASRKLARMLLKELVDQMFAGEVGVGGHRGADGRWYVFKGLSPDLVEVSDSVIESVDKARFLEWLEPLDALLVRHLSGGMDRDEFLAAAGAPGLVEAATYPHRALQEAAIGGAEAAARGTSLRRPRKGPWDPRKDPDLRVCFAGEHGTIVVGGGQSHLIDQAYREALRVVRQMSERELLDVARRVPGEMLQPDYPNLIRNVAARVTPILGLPLENRLEIREDMEAGGRVNLLLMLALSRARHAGWLSDAVVEEIYALRARNGAADGAAEQGIELHREMVARLMDRPEDRGVVETLDASQARIVVGDALQLLQRQRAPSPIASPADRVRRGLALLKILALHGVLDGFMIFPYAGRHLIPAQFGRLAALYEKVPGPEAASDRQSFLDALAHEEEVCRRAGLHADRIAANLVTQRVTGLIAHAAAVAERARSAALQEVPDRPVTLLFHLRHWIDADPSSPAWARDLDQAYARLLAPWATALRPGDYVVLFDADAAFRERLAAGGEFEEVALGLEPPDAERPEPATRSARTLTTFGMPTYAVTLRKACEA